MKHLLLLSMLLLCCTTCACLSVALGRRSEDVLQVHVVPHTHDDVGWLKTVDEYYYGANNSIQDCGVQYILDTVVHELSLDPTKTFIYVEIAYFYRWWNEQDEATKQLVKKLVANKQLEFVNAGWCMNDEASTHYNAIVDQMSLGLRFVEENFGAEARPRVAWHIDPFGHSAEQAALFAKMGYDGFFFARIDYDDFESRKRRVAMEMVWRGSASLGSESDLFTGVLFYGYGPPPGFCFDHRCHSADPPIQDDPNLFDYNVDQRVALFLERVREQAKYYTTNNVMLTFGSDFEYQNAVEVFKNLDKLIKYVNQNGSVNMFYSTPTRYVEAVHKAQKTWTLKTDDFFPYASGPYSFWSGYFTSRPALKGYTRQCNNYLQVCKQLEAIHGTIFHGKPSVTTLKQALAVDQHHDAVSGTEKQHVADDYAKRLHIGQVECEDIVSTVLSSLSARNSSAPEMKFQFCELANISVCPASESNSFNVLVYNPIGRTLQALVSLPVSGDSFTVVAPNGSNIPYQVVPLSAKARQMKGRRAVGSSTIFFQDEIPPLGFKTFLVRPAASAGLEKLTATEEFENEGKSDIVLDNGVLELTFDGSTGRLSHMRNLLSGVQVAVDQQFLWWNSSAGNNVNSTQASGAYIFRPNGTAPLSVSEGNRATVTVVKGEFVTEVRQEFNPWVHQVVRLVARKPFAEFQFTVGPIPFQDELGKEVVSRFSTDITTAGVWYTDANGREIQKRKYICDERKDVQFTVLTDRSQGGSSLNDGQLELMVHRRCLHDDGKGVDEALNETHLVVTGSHFVSLDHIADATVVHRVLAEALMLRPWLAVLHSTQSYSDYVKNYHMNDLFTAFKITSVRELTLGGNAALSSVHRLHWNTAEDESSESLDKNRASGSIESPFTVLLKPMEIRTFEANIEWT